MDFDRDGNLVVCDPVKGLVSIDPSGKVSNLVPVDGEIKLGFTDDCEISDDGTIYFSDASEKFGVGSYMEDMLEGRPHGKLLAYEPATKKTTVLMDKLYFANGVAVGPQDEFVLVNETYRFRVMRYWLKGENQERVKYSSSICPATPMGSLRARAAPFGSRCSRFATRWRTGSRDALDSPTDGEASARNSSQACGLWADH